MSCLAGADERIECATTEAQAFRLPTGAALYTAVIAYSRRMERSNSRSIEDCYASGGRFITAANLFGVNAEAIAQRLFANRLSAREVLERHTLFGFYCRGQSSIVQEEFASYLAKGDGASLLKYLNVGGMPFTVKGSLRYCPDCAAEEWATSGIAWWKIQHQLPFWSHCDRHAVELVSGCGACNSPYDPGNYFRLPGEACRMCKAPAKSRRLAEVSEGARALVAMSERVLDGETEFLQPASWRNLVDRVVSHFGGIADAHRALSATLCELWGVRTLSEIGHVAQGSIRPDFLSRELNLHANQGELASRIVTMNAILKSSVGRHHSLEALSRPDEQWDESPRGRLELAAIAAGIPVSAARMIVDGAGNADVTKKIGLSQPRLTSFLDALPVESWAGVIPGRRLQGAKAVPLSRRHGDFIPSSQSQGHYRACLEEAKQANPDLTRTQARQAHGSAMRWLTANDFGWLHRLLPPKLGSGRSHPKFLSEEERRKAYRSRVQCFMQQNPASTRTEISNACSGEVAWLRKNDLKWFEATVRDVRLAGGMHQHRYRDDSHRRRVYRKILREALARNPGATRSQLRIECPKALSWVASEDSEWLDRIVPSRQGQKG